MVKPFPRILGLVGFLLLFSGDGALAQGASTASGIVRGTVTDANGAAVSGAQVTVENPVSQVNRSAVSDATGKFTIPNVPFDHYHMTVSANGFQATVQDVEVRSVVPVAVSATLKLASVSQSVTVSGEAADLLSTQPTESTNVDKDLFDKLPLESESSSISSLVTLASPGIAADSNGLFHGLGDHAENSFSVDGQPITDQQSKVFSNQIPADAVQTMEVIDGAPPAEYGGKTSVVINVTTRSGLGAKAPHGDVTASYGTFGSTDDGFDFLDGGEHWGNYIALSGLNTSRFLDPPEFQVMHDKGNEENFFDRIDLQRTNANSYQLNLGATRSWFQTPNSFDQQLQTCTVLSADCNAAGTTQVDPLTGQPLGPTDQRSQIRTFNVAPSWTHVFGTNAVGTLGAFVRHDQYNYYGSNNPFSDLGPIQDETTSQLRFLTNIGLRADWSYVKGIHNVKIGGTAEQTLLTENDGFGIVNPGLLPAFGCNDPNPPAQCATLKPYDMTTGGGIYRYHGHTDVKEYALYAEDTLTKGPWTMNLGVRADVYRGLDASSTQPEPRAGIAYNIKGTNTVMRISYARTLESPFNENLILSGTGCNDPVVNAVMTVAQGFACTTSPLTPGFRNEFHAGLEQAIGTHFVLSGEYIWKYTHNGYDFNVFGASPITLPIEWHGSKIPGYAVRASVPNFHGVSAFVVMSSVEARFFPPTVSGIAPPAPPGVFRIDHDERFNQTTHLQYQPFKRAPWVGFNWRYDSGLVSGFVPCLAATATCSFSTSTADGGAANIPAGSIALVNNLNGAALTADQEYESGLFCGAATATPTKSLPATCPANQLGSTLVAIPAPGTESDDHNPQRIAPRSLFDLAAGQDDILRSGSDRFKLSARVTVINLANKVALYNFLSTFSGTHYVTPRTITAELGFHF